jgi:transcriptional regulator of acetoin/glycerol metabolism
MKINLKPELLLALEKNLGIVTPACKEVGISRNVFYQ